MLSTSGRSHAAEEGLSSVRLKIPMYGSVVGRKRRQKKEGTYFFSGLLFYVV
jgi:hypothetical protein